MFIINKIGGFLVNHFEDFTKYIVCALAGTGILCAIIGHYGKLISEHQFSWGWFLFFDIPLYIFCGWALYKAYKMYKNAKQK